MAIKINARSVREAVYLDKKSGLSSVQKLARRHCSCSDSGMIPFPSIFRNALH